MSGGKLILGLANQWSLKKSLEIYCSFFPTFISPKKWVKERDSAARLDLSLSITLSTIRLRVNTVNDLKRNMSFGELGQLRTDYQLVAVVLLTTVAVRRNRCFWAVSQLTRQQTIIALVIRIIYNVFFHPLRNFPGPKTAAATSIPFAWHLCNGRLVDWVTSLHEQYGEVVRINPAELSFVGAAAWQDIFMSRPELQKPRVGTISWPNGVPPLPNLTNSDDHTRQKRIVNHAFSDKALKGQEYILDKYSDILINRLTDEIRNGNGTAEVNMADWLYFATFDIIGEVCFSEELQSLQLAWTHPWLAGVFQGVKIGKILTACDHFPVLRTLVKWCKPPAAKRTLHRNFQWVQVRVENRLAQKSDKPDFLKFVVENNDRQGMTRDEIDSMMKLLLLTGSGATTVVVMSALLYFVLQRSEVLNTLLHKIQTHVDNNQGKITVPMVSKMEYLEAVLKETMRMHAPVPAASPRVVNRKGVQICGMSVPPGTRVGIPQKTMYRLPSNFVEPKTFLPERWLDNPQGRFAADNKACFEPFMVGVRSCIGKKFALAEMKLILVKVLWNFKLTLSERNEGDWCDQKSYLVNEKKPLYIGLELKRVEVYANSVTFETWS